MKQRSIDFCRTNKLFFQGKRRRTTPRCNQKVCVMYPFTIEGLSCEETLYRLCKMKSPFTVSLVGHRLHRCTGSSLLLMLSVLVCMVFVIGVTAAGYRRRTRVQGCKRRTSKCCRKSLQFINKVA